MTLPLVNIPVLETERLILRAPIMDDLPEMIAFYSSANSHTVGGPVDAIGATLRLYATSGQWSVQRFGSWHITDRNTGQWLGRTGFLFAAGWTEPELGWAITSEAEGQGIAYEATLAARKYGAEHLGLLQPISYIRPTNTRSVALAHRLCAKIECETEFLGKPCYVFRHPNHGEIAA